VLSLGTVERRKNVRSLIAAFERLAVEHPSVRLVIAGAPGNDQAAVDAAIKLLTPTIADRILQLGVIDEALKSQLLRHATALGYVSLDEGFGFPLLEAQQVALPIVASTAGSIPEIAGSAALFSSPHDIDAIAANLHLAVTSSSVRSKLALQASRNLDRFSWATTASLLTNLYHDLVNGVR
jgi:glycosyltransferase involved in cell wall biosynthesis